MKKPIIAVTTAAVLCGVFVCLSEVCGQNAAARERRATSSPNASPPLKIAVIDVKVILREYRKSVDMRQEIQAIQDAGNAKIRQLQGEGQQLIKPLQEGKLDPESEEFSARERKAAQLEYSIKASKANGERDMKKHGVKIMHAVYQDLQQALKLFCEQNGYTLVLQVDREATGAQDYRAINQIMGQQIFYHRSPDDITTAVLGYLNRHYQPAQDDSDESTPPVSATGEPNRTLPVSPNRKANSR